jgi:hypothetical protein
MGDLVPAALSLSTALGGGHLPSVGLALVGAFVLGVVHGVTPDEHTWPITFSYAVGSFSARRGMRSALAFSLGFTVQRALLSEVAYLGLLSVRENPTWNAVIYLLVGVVMVAAAFYVLRLRCTLHAAPTPVAAAHRRLPPPRRPSRLGYPYPGAGDGRRARFHSRLGAGRWARSR